MAKEIQTSMMIRMQNLTQNYKLYECIYFSFTFLLSNKKIIFSLQFIFTLVDKFLILFYFSFSMDDIEPSAPEEESNDNIGVKISEVEFGKLSHSI